MTTLTIRLPDKVKSRIKTAATEQGVSINQWLADLSVQALEQRDAKTRAMAMAANADLPTALAILDRLDREDEENRRTVRNKKRRRIG